MKPVDEAGCLAPNGFAQLAVAEVVDQTGDGLRICFVEIIVDDVVQDEYTRQRRVAWEREMRRARVGGACGQGSVDASLNGGCRQLDERCVQPARVRE